MMNCSELECLSGGGSVVDQLTEIAKLVGSNLDTFGTVRKRENSAKTICLLKLAKGICYKISCCSN
jgi:hypothetical protein